MVWQKAVSNGKGSIDLDVYQNYKCFRSADCSLIEIKSTKCEACRNQQKSMKDQIRRLNQGKDQIRTNNRYLDKSQLGEKASNLQKEKRSLKKKIDRLERKIEKEIESNSIGISHDHDLSEDLTKIFEKHNINMIPVEKLFWSQKMKALSVKEKNRRSMRWNPFIIKLALHIQMRSGSSGYRYLKQFLELPSERLLYDYTHHFEAKEGIQEAALQNLSVKVQKLKEEYESYFSVAFDEVHVMGGVVINERTGEVVGYTHLSKVEEEMQKLEADMAGVEFSKEPANSVLMFLALGITTDLQCVVAIYPTRALTSGQLFTRTWHVLYSMESYALKPLCLICDGAAANKKFFRMHPCISDPNTNSDVVYATVNLTSHTRRPVSFIVDPPHLLKTLRNCLANSYSHKRSRKMWKNGEDLSWEVLEKLYEHTMLDKFRSNKLTRMHVKLTAFICMKVSLAAQAMSLSAVDVDEISELAERTSVFEGKHTSELCCFIKHVNDSVHCFNSCGDISGKRNKRNNLLLPYKDLNDMRFHYLSIEMLDFFKDWFQDTRRRRGEFSNDAKERMFISYQSYESLKITTFGFIGTIKFMLSMGAPQIDGRKLNQDKLEQKFGILRMSGGGTRSLGVSEIAQKVLSLEAQGEAALPPKQGNTETIEKPWTPDETPLPKLKRRKSKA